MSQGIRRHPVTLFHTGASSTINREVSSHGSRALVVERLVRGSGRVLVSFDHERAMDVWHEVTEGDVFRRTFDSFHVRVIDKPDTARSLGGGSYGPVSTALRGLDPCVEFVTVQDVAQLPEGPRRETGVPALEIFHTGTTASTAYPLPWSNALVHSVNVVSWTSGATYGSGLVDVGSPGSAVTGRAHRVKLEAEGEYFAVFPTPKLVGSDAQVLVTMDTTGGGEQILVEIQAEPAFWRYRGA